MCVCMGLQNDVTDMKLTQGCTGVHIFSLHFMHSFNIIQSLNMFDKSGYIYIYSVLYKSDVLLSLSV